MESIVKNRKEIEGERSVHNNAIAGKEGTFHFLMADNSLLCFFGGGGFFRRTIFLAIGEKK